MLLLSCGFLFAEYRIEAGNHTELSDTEIDGFVAKLVSAINNNNEKNLLSLFHPQCRKVIEENEDVSLFVKYLLDNTIPSLHNWKATSFKDPNSYLFKINRFVVKPTMNIDIFWNASDEENPKNIKAMSVMLVKDDGSLFLVSYMNDYLKEQLNN